MNAPASERLTLRLGTPGLLRVHPVHADLQTWRPEAARQIRLLGFVSGRSGMHAVYLPPCAAGELERHGFQRKESAKGGTYWLAPSSAVWWKVARDERGQVTVTPEPRREGRTALCPSSCD